MELLPLQPRPAFFSIAKNRLDKKGLFFKRGFCPTVALSKLAYRMQRSALPVTRYASPVTAPCAPNAQTVEIAFILLRQFENFRGYAGL
jgi:hypothetical protein